MIARMSIHFAKWTFVLFLVLNIIMATLTNVPTIIRSSDEEVFTDILHLKKPYAKLSYEQEIKLIRHAQLLVLKHAPMGSPIPDYSDREPADLLRHRSGLCYDRSRTYDKIFSWLGFEVRHVYILYPEHPITNESLPYWRALLTRGTNSHAVTEVKTSKGWILVDSNSPWISLTRTGKPVDGDDIQANAKSFDNLPVYFNRPYIAIRGMYSRRGHLYRPYLPYPELNWLDFWTWILGVGDNRQ